jgi:hypothetical protein
VVVTVGTLRSWHGHHEEAVGQVAEAEVGVDVPLRQHLIILMTLYTFAALVDWWDLGTWECSATDQ